MSEIISTQPMQLPVPTTPMTVRAATREDVPFMDALQKKYRNALGFFPRAQMEEYVDAGNVLIAVGARLASTVDRQSTLSVDASVAPTGDLIGYIASKDRYLKRDELGAVFQLCVAPGRERGFIAANLLREVFERSSYGCRLYCCWCAQDLPANRFWEAMGFVPIAYRAGGRGQRSEVRGQKSPRVHIYWQKRIRAGDTTTPYWFPAKTEGGAIREDRIILPIPPGMKWTDELPILTPASSVEPSGEERPESVTAKDGPAKQRSKRLKDEPDAVHAKKPAKTLSMPNGIRVAPRPAEALPRAIAVKKRKPVSKADPALIAKARELRDRYLEHANASPWFGEGKYNVTKAFSAKKTAGRIESLIVADRLAA